MNIKVRYLAAIAAGMLMATHTVVAAEQEIVGRGAASCGQFIFDDDSLNRTHFISWAQGYLTGLNVKYYRDKLILGAGTTDLQDTTGQEVWLENYCLEYPLDLYFTAVNYLWVALREQQGLERDSRIKSKDQR